MTKGTFAKIVKYVGTTAVGIICPPVLIIQGIRLYAKNLEVGALDGIGGARDDEFNLDEFDYYNYCTNVRISLHARQDVTAYECAGDIIEAVLYKEEPVLGEEES